MTTRETPKMLVPAALGGLFIGVLSALPVVNLLNVCCCLWVVSGGALAAYLAQQDLPRGITTSEGAVVGLLAGVFGAAAATLIGLPLGLLMAPFQERVLQGLLSSGAELPPAARAILEQMASTEGVGTATVLVASAIRFGLALVVNSVMATVGGLLGALFLRRSHPPAPPAAGGPLSSEFDSSESDRAI